MNNTAPTPSNGIVIFTIVSGFCISAMGLLASTITVVTIVKTKKLHTPCFILISGSTIGSFVLATYFLATAVDQLGTYLSVLPALRSSFWCVVPTAVLALWGIPFHALMTFCIAVDRLASILTPNQYRLWSERQSLGALVACVLFVTGQAIAGFSTAQLNSFVRCDMFGPLNPGYIAFFVKINLSLCFGTVVGYTVMWIVFQFRYKQYHGRSVTDAGRFMKRQLAVVPTVKLMALLYLATGITSEVVVNFSFALPHGTAAFALLSVGQCLKNASSLVEAMALLIRNKTFRDACRKLFGSKPQTVAPAGTSQLSRPRAADGRPIQ